MPRLSEQGFLLVAGRALEYTYFGACEGRDPVIVLLHEGLGCCAMWHDFPQQLNAACRLPVLSYSRAGYGRSDGIGLPWPISYMHDEALITLPALLDAAGIDDAILVGHSDGASIATIYAGSAPRAAICGVVLMAPHFFVEDISVASIAAAGDEYRNGDLRSALMRYHGLNTDEAFRGWNGAWLDPEFRDWDITGFLAKLAAPVLGIQGADDQYGTAAQLDAIDAHCAAPAEALMLDDCGHSPHRDQPDRVLRAIAKFVAQHCK